MNECSGIHSFIHIEHLYSASSRKLLRSAPNISTVKQSRIGTNGSVFGTNTKIEAYGKDRYRTAW